MLRAAGQFVLAGGHIVSGGSTLTMQVARLLDGATTRERRRQAPPDRCSRRQLEAQLSKDADPRPLPDARALWRQHRGRPRREPRLFRQGADAADHRRGGAARRAAAIAGGAPPGPRSRGRQSRPRPRARPAGRAPASSPPRRPTPPRPRRSRRRAGLSRCSPPHLAEQAVAAHPDRPVQTPHHRPRPAGLARDARRRPRRGDRAEALGRHRRRRPPDRRRSSPRSARPASSTTERAGHVDMTARRPLARLDAEAADLRPRLRAGPRPSRKPDRGPADRLRRLCAGRISTASIAAR